MIRKSAAAESNRIRMTLMVVQLGQPRIAMWKHVTFCTLAIAWFSIPLQAQRGNPPSGGGSRVPTLPRPVWPPELEPGVFFPDPQPAPKPVAVEDDACLPWDLSGLRGTTVSAVR